MPLIVITKPFNFAHHGYQVEAFEASDEPRETTDECAELAVAEGWARLPDADPAAAEQATAKRAKREKPIDMALADLAKT